MTLPVPGGRFEGNVVSIRSVALVLAVVVAAIGCAEGGPPIDEDRFVDVQVELHLIEARPGTDTDRVELRTRALTEHGVDEHQLEAATRYYADNLDDYVAVYERIVDRLTEERARLGASG